MAAVCGVCSRDVRRLLHAYAPGLWGGGPMPSVLPLGKRARRHVDGPLSVPWLRPRLRSAPLLSREVPADALWCRLIHRVAYIGGLSHRQWPVTPAQFHAAGVPLDLGGVLYDGPSGSWALGVQHGAPHCPCRREHRAFPTLALARHGPVTPSVGSSVFRPGGRNPPTP